MKSPKLLLSVIALAAFAAAPALRAEDAPAKPKAERPHVDRIKELTDKLGLTEDQVAKLKPIIADEAAAMKALREDKSLDKDAKRAKMMEIRKSHMEQIDAILTPEQQAKLKAGREGHQGPKKEKGKDKPAS